MKKLHIALTLLCFVGSAVGIITQDEVIPMLSCALLLAGAILQIPAMVLAERKSAVFRMKTAHIAMILLAAAMVFCAAVIFGLHWAVYAVAAVLLLSIAALIPQAVPTDFDPTGEDFVTALTEALDTISRATAERDCGIDTQLLYEQARFCEPITNPNIRSAEREILRRIFDIKPYDSDEEISHKCSTVSELLLMRKNAAEK